MIYSGVAKPTYFSSALVRGGSVWEEGGGSKLGDRLVSFAPEDEIATSAHFLYLATRQLNRGTRLWGPRRRGFYTAHTWGKEANAAAAAVKAAFLRGREVSAQGGGPSAPVSRQPG